MSNHPVKLELQNHTDSNIHMDAGGITPVGFHAENELE